MESGSSPQVSLPMGARSDLPICHAAEKRPPHTIQAHMNLEGDDSDSTIHILGTADRQNQVLDQTLGSRVVASFVKVE